MRRADLARSVPAGTGGVVAALALALGGTPRESAAEPTALPVGRPETVRFASDGIALAGRLRLPSGPPPYPAVVLLAGSLATGADDGRLAAIGDALLARGFAVLTTDSRGVGGSGGVFESASFDDLARDAAAAVEALRARPDVHGRGIGLWGVSQGATWVGPLAAERAGAAFLVGVAGPLESPETHVHRFLGRRLRETQRLDDAAVERIARARARLWSYYATGAGFEAARAALEPLRAEPWYPTSGLPSTVTPPEELAALPVRTRTFLAQKDFDPLSAIGRLGCPFLALYGELDDQLPVDRYGELLRELAARTGARVAVEIVPGHDHDLRPVGEGANAAVGESPLAAAARWAEAALAR